MRGLSTSHHPDTFCFSTVKAPESKCTFAQHNKAKELLNDTHRGVLRSQVWFHIGLTSARVPAILSQQTRNSSNFTVTSAREESVGQNETTQKFSCFSSKAFCLCHNSIDFPADFVDRQCWALLEGGAYNDSSVYVWVCIDRWLSLYESWFAHSCNRGREI